MTGRMVEDRADHLPGVRILDFVVLRFSHTLIEQSAPFERSWLIARYISHGRGLDIPIKES